MSDPVFVVDATGTPLMPMAPAYARRLLQNGKAHIVQHHTLSIIQLTRDIASPTLRPLVLAVAIHLDSAELFLIAAGNQRSFPLAHILIDLRTDLAWRIRRRAGHRRRRHLRSRYHAPRRMGMPYKLHRPSLARSQWGSELRQRHQRTHRRGRQSGSPVMHWRAQAICRVIAVLRGYAPISQVLIVTPPRTSTVDIAVTPSERRQHVANRYQQAVADDGPGVVCAYCGGALARIEVDHVHPQGQSGTDAHNNLVFACSACGARKGNRRPDAAGMPIRYGPVPTAILSNRARPYMRWTARLLQARLRNLGLSTWWGIAGEPLPLEEPLSAALCRFMEHPNLVRDPLIAHPVSRPRKQVFTAHNYPLNTPLSPGVVRQPSTVKRRIIVNRGILRQEHNGRVSVRVVTVDEPRLPEEERLIIIGTLCEGERAGHSILGIVGAIFSTGKLALMRPTAYREQRIIWERILVSSRKSLHVRSRERILFLRLHVDK